jgi:hypothetical protein
VTSPGNERLFQRDPGESGYANAGHGKRPDQLKLLLHGQRPKVRQKSRP